MNQKKEFSWGELILGIIFILTSLIAFQNPAGDLLAVVVIFAVVAIVKGIFEIFVRNRFKEFTGRKATSLLVIGIIDIIVGIFLLFNLSAGMIALPFVFAFWFIMDSIEGLFTLDLAKMMGKGFYWFSLIVAILGIFVGIYLFINPAQSAFTLAFLVGFYFMWAGIINIISAFQRN